MSHSIRKPSNVARPLSYISSRQQRKGKGGNFTNTVLKKYMGTSLENLLSVAIGKHNPSIRLGPRQRGTNIFKVRIEGRSLDFRKRRVGGHQPLYVGGSRKGRRQSSTLF